MQARSAPPVRPTPTLLRLPPGCGRSFWRDAEVQRVLLCIDTLNCLFSLLALYSSVSRMTAAFSDVRSLLGAPLTLHLRLAAAATAITVASLAPLLLLVTAPRLYYEHRLPLMLCNRLLRVLINSATMAQPLSIAAIADAVFGRVRKLAAGGSAGKALAVLVLHPVTLWSQQAFFVLPWRLVVPLQIINLVTMLRWSYQLPCWLHLMLPGALPSSSGSSAAGVADVRRAAQRVCGVLQSWATLLRDSADSTSLALVPPGVSSVQCEGHAVQLLQVYVSCVFILVLPCALVFHLERQLKLRFCRRLHASAAAGQPASGDAGAGGATTDVGGAADGSRSSSGGGSSGVAATEAGFDDPWARGLLVLLHLLVVLSLAWLLSEMIVEWFHDSGSGRDCLALWAAAGVGDSVGDSAGAG